MEKNAAEKTRKGIRQQKSGKKKEKPINGMGV